MGKLPLFQKMKTPLGFLVIIGSILYSIECEVYKYRVFSLYELFRLLSHGQILNCQLCSFIAVHGQFYSNRLGLYCQMTI